MKPYARVVVVLALVGAALLWFSASLRGSHRQAATGVVKPVRAAQPAIASVPLPQPASTITGRLAAGAKTGEQCGTLPWQAASAPMSDTAIAAGEARAAWVAEQVAEQTLAAMRNSADPRARAAGLLLKPLLAELETLRKENPAAPCEAGNCVSLPSPRTLAGPAPITWPDADADAPGPFDTLAQIAAGSADPTVYAMAFHACNHGTNATRGGACRLISAAQWARLDPGNAVPWAFVAAAAQARGDTSAVSEAMHQIAQSRRSHQGWGVLPGLVLDHAPAAAEALPATHQLLVEVFSVEAAWVSPVYQTIGSFCKVDAVADPNRRETCRQIAEVLAERSDTLLARNFGASIGKRVGWPAARTDAMRAELETLSQTVADASVDPAQPACAALRRSVDYIRSLGADGELGAMRRLARR